MEPAAPVLSKQLLAMDNTTLMATFVLFAMLTDIVLPIIPGQMPAVLDNARIRRVMHLLHHTQLLEPLPLTVQSKKQQAATQGTIFMALRLPDPVNPALLEAIVQGVLLQPPAPKAIIGSAKVPGTVFGMT
jgi:hypothetical protein